MHIAFKTMVVFALVGCGSNPSTGDAGTEGGTNDSGTDGSASHQVKTAFIILMENHNWSDILGSTSAPYINKTLLPMGAHCEQYFNPPGNHPSEPNYLWLEAGQNFGIQDDNPPATNHQSSTQHMVTQMKAANVTWKSYQEDISGADCPLVAVKQYAPKHDAFVFFDDVTDGDDAGSMNCIQHVRPYTELAGDLTGGTVAQYNFITPNLCDDMHDTCTGDAIAQGDTWLSTEVPKILASNAYKNGGVLFITWDESENGDFPIGMIVLSPLAKPNYTSMTKYTHGSTLRSFQEIFGLTPLLGDANNQQDLSELFTAFP